MPSYRASSGVDTDCTRTSIVDVLYVGVRFPAGLVVYPADCNQVAVVAPVTIAAKGAAEMS